MLVAGNSVSLPIESPQSFHCIDFSIRGYRTEEHLYIVRCSVVRQGVESGLVLAVCKKIMAIWYPFGFPGTGWLLRQFLQFPWNFFVAGSVNGRCLQPKSLTA